MSFEGTVVLTMFRRLDLISCHIDSMFEEILYFYPLMQPAFSETFDLMILMVRTNTRIKHSSDLTFLIVPSPVQGTSHKIRSNFKAFILGPVSSSFSAYFKVF